MAHPIKNLCCSVCILSIVTGCGYRSNSTGDPEIAGPIPLRAPGPPSPPIVEVDDDHDHEARGAASAELPFFQLLGATSFNEVPLTDEEVIRSSSVIVTGTIASIVDGRTIDYMDGPANPLHTAVFEIRVGHVTKGNPGSSVYVEYLRGGIPPEALDEAKFEGDILLFLHEADDWNPDVHKFINEGLGLPDGQTLYALRTQRGLLVEFNGTVEQPLEPDDPIVEGDTLESVERNLDTM